MDVGGNDEPHKSLVFDLLVSLLVCVVDVGYLLVHCNTSESQFRNIGVIGDHQLASRFHLFCRTYLVLNFHCRTRGNLGQTRSQFSPTTKFDIEHPFNCSEFLLFKVGESGA